MVDSSMVVTAAALAEPTWPVWIEMARNVMEIVGLLVVGLWALWRFKRAGYPNPQISADLSATPSSWSSAAASREVIVETKVANKGDFAYSLSHSSLRIWRLADWDETKPLSVKQTAPLLSVDPIRQPYNVYKDEIPDLEPGKHFDWGAYPVYLEPGEELKGFTTISLSPGSYRLAFGAWLNRRNLRGQTSNRRWKVTIIRDGSGHGSEVPYGARIVKTMTFP